MFDIVETNSEVSDDKFNKMSIQHIFVPQIQLSADEAKQFLPKVTALSFHVSLQDFYCDIFLSTGSNGRHFSCRGIGRHGAVQFVASMKSKR